MTIRMGPSAWNGTAKTRTIYRVDDERYCNSRIGNCWAEGRLKMLDLLLCDKQSGDCFYDYYLIDYTNFRNKLGVHMKLIPYRIGAYKMGEELHTLNDREYHLLMAGEEVEVVIGSMITQIKEQASELKEEIQ